MTAQPTKAAFKVEPRYKIHGYQIMNAAHLPDTPDRSPLVEDFLYDTDTMLLYAPAGGYKSMVAINLAVAVASGGTFMGKQAYQQRVLFVDGELSAYSFKQRFELFGCSENLDILSECFQPPERLHELPPIQLEQMTPPNQHARQTRRHAIAGDSEQRKRRGWQEEILTLVRVNEYKLVVLDNVRTLTVETDENNAKDVAALNTLVKRLRYLGCAVLVIHHTRKGKDETGASVFAGSSNLLTVYNTAICIETPCSNVISFTVDKDRENSIGDYFRETHWQLDSSPGVGFLHADAYAIERAEMCRLIRRIDNGEFTTKGAIVGAARKEHGLKFGTSGGALKGLWAKLDEEDVVCGGYTAFNTRVTEAIKIERDVCQFGTPETEDF